MNCKKHTQQQVKQVKTKARPKTKKGGLKLGVRHMFKISKGYGGMPRPKIGEKYKTSTHPTMLFTCGVCGKSTMRKYRRAKKVTQV